MTTPGPTPRTTLIVIPNQWWLTSNMRLHWAAKAKRTAALRQMAYLEGLRDRRRFRKVRVIAHIGYASSTRADPGNAAPAVKACIDGLTDAGWWADDDSEHLIGPDYRRDPVKAPKGHHTVRLEIEEVES